MCRKSNYLIFVIALVLLSSCKKSDPVKNVVKGPRPYSGQYLLFDADEAFNTGENSFPSAYTSIYYSNLDGTNITQITPTDPGYYSYRPEWSPDGKQVLFIRGNRDDSYRSVCTIDINGSNFKSVVKGNKVDFASFSPDGKKLVYAKSLVDSIPFKYDVYTSNVDGTAEQRITSFAKDNGEVANIQWAANGKIYFNGTGDHTKTGVYSINGDGTNLQYVMTDVFFLAVSPDGSKILFDLGNGLFSCNSDGTNIKTIITYDNTNPNMLVGASWSSDGNQIYLSNADYPSNLGIYRVNSDGTNLHRILYGYYEYPVVF